MYLLFNYLWSWRKNINSTENDKSNSNKHSHEIKAPLSLSSEESESDETITEGEDDPVVVKHLIGPLLETHIDTDSESDSNTNDFNDAHSETDSPDLQLRETECTTNEQLLESDTTIIDKNNSPSDDNEIVVSPETVISEEIITGRNIIFDDKLVNIPEIVINEEPQMSSALTECQVPITRSQSIEILSYDENTHSTTSSDNPQEE